MRKNENPTFKVTAESLASALLFYENRNTIEMQNILSCPLAKSEKDGQTFIIEFYPKAGKFVLGVDTGEEIIRLWSFDISDDVQGMLILSVIDSIGVLSRKVKDRFTILCPCNSLEVLTELQNLKEREEEFTVPMHLTVSVGAVGDAVREFEEEVRNNSGKDKTFLLATGRTKKSFICLFFDFNGISDYKFTIRITRQDIKREDILSEERFPFMVSSSRLSKRAQIIESLVNAIKVSCRDDMAGFPLKATCPEPKDIWDYMDRTEKDTGARFSVKQSGMVFERDVIGNHGESVDIIVPKSILYGFLEKLETLKKKDLDEHADTVVFFGSGGEAEDNIILMLSANNISEHICITVMHGNYAMPLIISPMDGESFSVEELSAFLSSNRKLEETLKTFSRTFWDNRKISVSVTELKPQRFEVDDDD